MYFSGFYPTGIPFVQALRAAGYTGPVLAGDAMYDQVVIDGLGELAEQDFYVTLPSPPLGAGDSFGGSGGVMGGQELRGARLRAALP